MNFSGASYDDDRRRRTNRRTDGVRPAKILERRKQGSSYGSSATTCTKQRQGRGSPKRAPATIFSVGVEGAIGAETHDRAFFSVGGEGERGATYCFKPLSKKYMHHKTEVSKYGEKWIPWIPDGFRMDSGRFYWKYMDSVDSGNVRKRENHLPFTPL